MSKAGATRLLDKATSPQLAAMRNALADRPKRALASFTLGGMSVEVHLLCDGLWLLLGANSAGGLALRAGPPLAGCRVRKLAAEEGELARFRMESDLGMQDVAIGTRPGALGLLRATCTFTPAAGTRLPFVPRDIIAFGPGNDPFAVGGVVAAVQRDLNSGLAYFRIERPQLGNFLYFQNFTALSDYFIATGTTPDGVVGGAWPEIGLELPVAEPDDEGNVAVLAAGQPVVLSDAMLVIRHECPRDEREVARHFLQMLGTAYRQLDLPATTFHDWTWRAERTLHDLDKAPEATISHYGHRYIHPYTAAEYPDVMVQMTLVQAIHEWGKWRGEPHPLEAEFMAGMPRFYDSELQSLRRYLPNVGDDKDADAVDSWYLYHPLLNLGKLALDGDARARQLFLQSLDYGIKAAHHFRYKWPIQYKVGDFAVITETTEFDGRGQTDVGGIYAWVMLQAFALTDDKRYLDEARAAIDAAIGLGFDINYQANLTAWGAAACMRLWRITDRDVYREQSYVYLASFFHHCEIWLSDIGHAAHYNNFLGVTCLQDAPYMALYECFDSYAAFEHYLSDSGPDLEPAARLLIAEYCRYALDRAWSYYPDALPPEAISDEQRENNGHIDPSLSFPLEDLYADGQPAGQVGQEIYGAGAAMIFATRAFHPVQGAPFRLFCDHFVRAAERTDPARIILTVDGGETGKAWIALVRLKRRRLPSTTVVTTLAGERFEPLGISDDRIDYYVPANGTVIITWE